MAKAFEIWARDKDHHILQLSKWHDQIERSIIQNIPNVKFHHQPGGVRGLLSVGIEGVRGSELMTILSLQERDRYLYRFGLYE